MTKLELETKKELEGVRNKRLLCSDVSFKSIFLREHYALIKLITIITHYKEFNKIKEIIPGYEVEPYYLNGKVNKSDMIVKLDNKNFINIEVNYRHEKTVLARNMIQVFRIFGGVEESGMGDKELVKLKVAQININTFSNSNGKIIEKGFFMNSEGKKMEIISDMVTFWNLDIVKCHKILYNNIDKIDKLPILVRWGALLYTDTRDIEAISKIIGDVLLTKEEKEMFIGRIKSANDNDRIIQDWMVERNNKLKEENIINTAREEGMEEKTFDVIKNMLKEKASYEFISKVTDKSIEEIKKIEKIEKNIDIALD